MRSRFCLMLALLLAGCANELSDEQKVREVSDREFSRLQKAAGNYVGNMPGPDGYGVPTSVEVSVQKNPTPTGEKPVLLVVLTTGLFNGVRVSSSQAIYDFGTKQLSASFARDGSTPGAGKSSLEFRASVVDGVLLDPVLIGAHQGTHKLLLQKLDKEAPYLDEEFHYNFSIADNKGKFGKDRQAQLVLKTRKEPQDSPPDADLPLFPGLEASIIFENFAITPEVPSLILYDPLKATLELQFSKSSWVKLTNIYLATDAIKAKIAPVQMMGQLTLGGNKLRDVMAAVDTTGTTPVLFPPHEYVGTYQGGKGTLKSRMVGKLDYQPGIGGTNTPELPFLSFPNLQLELLAYLPGNPTPFKTVTQILGSLDHLNSKGHFRDKDSANDNPLDVVWTEKGMVMNGIFLKTGGGVTQEERPTFTLRAVPDMDGNGSSDRMLGE